MAARNLKLSFMMKKNYLFACLALVCSTAFVTSCQKEGDDVVAPVSKAVSFNDDSGLELKVGTTAMYGCNVKYTPDADDATKAVLTVEGAKNDMNAIISGLIGRILANGQPVSPFIRVRADNPAGIVTSGVLPGAPVLTIPVVLEIDGNTGKFSGTGETQSCSYSYKGSVSESSLILSIEDVKLKENILANSRWKIAEPNFAESKGGSTLVFDWSYKGGQNPSTVNFGLILGELVRSSVGLAIENRIYESVNSINFLEGGDITMTILDTISIPAGLGNYIVSNDKLVVYPNVQGIVSFVQPFIEAAAPSAELTKADDPTAMIMNIVGKLSGVLALTVQNGIPFNFDNKGDSMSIVLSDDFISTLIASLQFFMTDPDVNTLIQSYIASQLEGLEPAEQEARRSSIMAILQAVNENLMLTDKIVIGLNLQKIR